MPELLTVKQLAELLACSYTHARALLIDGTIAAVDIAAKPGRQKEYRVTRQAVDTFLASRSANALPVAVKEKKRRTVEARRPTGAINRLGF